MFKFFDTFLKKMKDNFRRIAAATKHEMTIEDIHQDAWVAAREISNKRGHEIDLSDPSDQDLITRALYVRNVKRPEKNLRFAARIDEDVEDEEGEKNSWENRLFAHETSDPLKLLAFEETMAERDLALASSYSEFAAYVIVLYNFDDDRARLCTYLVIKEGTLGRRMKVAEDFVTAQPSIFDRIETVDDSFMPLPGRGYAANIDHCLVGEQRSWNF